MRPHVTYHIEVKVSDLALAITAQGETVGQSADAVLSGIERLFAVMREGGFRILGENKRKNKQCVRTRFMCVRNAVGSRETYRDNHLGDGQSVEQRSSTVRAVVIRDMGQDHALSVERTPVSTCHASASIRTDL